MLLCCSHQTNLFRFLNIGRFSPPLVPMLHPWLEVLLRGKFCNIKATSSDDALHRTLQTSIFHQISLNTVRAQLLAPERHFNNASCFMFSSCTWVAGPMIISHKPRRITYKVWLNLASLRKMLTGTYGSDVYLRHFQKILQTLYKAHPRKPIRGKITTKVVNKGCF